MAEPINEVQWVQMIFSICTLFAPAVHCLLSHVPLAWKETVGNSKRDK